jgi:hypothetical protein
MEIFRRLGVKPVLKLRYVWENTGKVSQLRRLVVAFCGTYMGRECVEGDSDEYPKEILAQLVVRFIQREGREVCHLRAKDFHVKVED